VHLIVKNRITQYVKAAIAYSVVLQAIEDEVASIVSNHSQYITFDNKDVGIAEMRDFNTVGVVSNARGCPFYKLKSATYVIMGKRIKVAQDQLKLCVDEFNTIASKMKS